MRCVCYVSVLLGLGCNAARALVAVLHMLTRAAVILCSQRLHLRLWVSAERCINSVRVERSQSVRWKHWAGRGGKGGRRMPKPFFMSMHGHGHVCKGCVEAYLPLVWLVLLCGNAAIPAVGRPFVALAVHVSIVRNA
jgi:hypothetical protein